MNVPDARPRVTQRTPKRRHALLRTRLAAFGSLLAVVAVLAEIVLSSTGGSGSHATNGGHGRTTATTGQTTTVRTGAPGTAAVPILAYHVINVAPASSSLDPRLYVPATEFSAQMQALKAAGWHTVTLDQLRAYWTRGTSLGTAKPIVITFDDGYASQYTNALPVLKQLGWVGVEDFRVNGLSPADGGLTETQIRGLLAAGWELDAEGLSQPDLTVLGPSQLQSEIVTSRQQLQSTYSVPVNWFCYPSGNYNPTVTAAVHTAGFAGATTLVPGWASPQGNRFALPRLEVVGGTSASKLISQIAAAAQTTTTPTSSHA